MTVVGIKAIKMKLQIRNLTIGYEKQLVLKNLNLSAVNGDFIALIGKNGAGKSTFLKTLANILQPYSGDIFLEKQNLLAMSQQQRSRLISIVLTDKIDLPLQVYEFVSLGRQPYSGFFDNLSKIDRYVIEQVLNELNLQELKYRPITDLSDGEHQKVLIARALVQDTPILLLDEPTTHLDLENKAILIRKLREISQARSKLIILSTHDINLILPKIDKIWLTKNHDIIEKHSDESIEKLFDKNLLKYDQDCKRFRLV